MIEKGPYRESLPHLERAMGIEPTSKAWEAFVLPLNYARASAHFTLVSRRLSIGVRRGIVFTVTTALEG
jgi:hypothetical protein